MIAPEAHGVPPRELAAVVEQPYAASQREPQLAGAYAGLALESIITRGRHYLGEPELSWLRNCSTVLLGC